MKKILAMVLAACLTFGSLPSFCAFANDNTNSHDDKEIKHIKSEENYDYGSDTVYIARDKESGQIIPLSIGPLDGYSYAYISRDNDFTVEKVTYTSPFNDLGERYRYESYIHEISSREIVVGFEDGSFKPEKELTRAEMAVIFTRLFSVPVSDAVSTYDDVPRGHWAEDYIMSLLKRGVFIQDTYFNPNLSVTREQLVAMTYRMLCDMGKIDTKKEYDYSRWSDYEDITYYATEAFNALNANGFHIWFDLVDHDFLDTADDEYYFHPQRPVTRLECCEFIYQFIRRFFINNAPAIARTDAPEIAIPVLDGSTSTHAITKNIYSAYYHNYYNHPDFPKNHSKTVASYKRLIDGEVEMIFVPDAGEDVIKYAEEKGVKLKFIPIANEALIFFTGKDNKTSNITADQLHNIYAYNSITNWKELGGDDAVLAAYCRNEDSGSHAQMEQFVLNGKEISEDISKERTSLMMSSILTEVDDYNRNNKGKYAMGYSLFYYYQMNSFILGPLDLKLMSINGIEPSEETISSGTYPFTTNYYAVIRDGENNPKIDAFAELMQGEFGKNIAELSGLGVIKTPEF